MLHEPGWLVTVWLSFVAAGDLLMSSYLSNETLIPLLEFSYHQPRSFGHLNQYEVETASFQPRVSLIVGRRASRRWQIWLIFTFVPAR